MSIDKGMVLIVGDGASVHSRRLASAMVDRGVRIHLACFEGDPLFGVPFHHLGDRPPTSDLRYLLAIPRLAQLIRRLRPVVVHAHYVSSYGLMTAIALRLAHPTGNRPFLIQTAWGTDLLVTAKQSKIRRAMAMIAMRAADLITGDSRDLQQEAADLAPTVSFQRFVFGPRNALFSLERRPSNVIASTRRLDPDMRVALVIEAFRVANGTHPDLFRRWRLVLAGDGVQRDDLRQQAAGLDQVDFVGVLDPSGIEDLLSRAELLISVPQTDATSAALLEGMAAGVVPVVNDLPANREWVDGDVGEIVARDPTPSELADAMSRAILRRVSTEEIRAHVRSVSWETEIDGLRSIYGTIGQVLPRTAGN